MHHTHTTVHIQLMKTLTGIHTPTKHNNHNHTQKRTAKMPQIAYTDKEKNAPSPAESLEGAEPAVPCQKNNRAGKSMHP